MFRFIYVQSQSLFWCMVLQINFQKLKSILKFNIELLEQS